MGPTLFRNVCFEHPMNSDNRTPVIPCRQDEVPGEHGRDGGILILHKEATTVVLVVHRLARQG